MNRKITLMLTAIILSFTIWTPILPSLSDTQLTNDLASDWAPSVIQTSDGKIWVVWHSYRTGNADLFIKVHNGSSWSTDMQLTTNSSVDGLPSILQVSNGTIWVVWTSDRTGNYDLFHKTSSDGGVSWSAESQLTTDPDDDRRSSIFQAVNGTIWIVWQSRRTGNTDLFYKTTSDGGSSWSAETPLTTNPNDDKNPSSVQAADGTIWVVWTSSRTGNDDIFYKTSPDNGVSWSIETQLTTDPNIDSFPSVTQATDGNMWVAWQTDRNLLFDDIFYKIHDGSSWSPNNYLTWFMYNDIMPSLFQAANETMWLVWTSDKPSNFDLYYKFVIADMAISDFTTSKTIVPQGEQVDIYVLALNEGTAGVTFNVTTYQDDTPIGTQTSTMVPSFIPQQLVFTWNTAGIPYGQYIISANVSTAIRENDLSDNYAAETVTVTILGDVNGDGVVDISDGGAISAHWYPGPPVGILGYDPNVDINNDGAIDILDAAIVSANWHNSW